MARVHTEEPFEDTIVEALVTSGWRPGDKDAYLPDLGLDPSQLVPFVEATQPDAWKTLEQFAGGNPAIAEREFLRLVAKQIDQRGTLDVLRAGVKDRGVRIKLAYFRPAHTVAEGALDEYRQNRLSVTRQLRYSATSRHELDLVLFVNGLPVATAELKNPLTGSTVDDAMTQYRTTRDPKELLFAKRALVHFAVDTDMVFLTTRLRGEQTVFLPFNQGTGGPGNVGGAGNPPAPADGSGYRTAYLWEQVWQKDNWLDLLKRFLHVQVAKGRTSVHDRPLIFPRYHQWHAVCSLTEHAARYGSGHNYLIMHSAGSGKSNTIGWLAHRLSTLHGSAEPGALDGAAEQAGRIEANQAVFHKVVVVTDRSVLDKQLQDTIYQFDHTPGVVQRITGTRGSKSAEVAEALANTASKIIIVTVQTFPHVLEGVSGLSGKRIAVIVDEAHSGQSGDSVSKLKKVLRGLGAEETGDDTDPLTSSAMAEGRHPNLSYFAFTATPKNKTLQLFGIDDPVSGDKRAFHIYSMRQAIDEKFILDVLRNYTTFKTYWRIAKEGAENIEVNPDKAGAEIARLVYLNPATMEAHAEIIARHFHKSTRKQLGGRSKAMVVTRSRESALRMFTALHKAFDDLSLPDPGLLLAFSGSLTRSGAEVTEANINGFPESQLPDAFAYTRADDPHAASRGKPGGTPERKEYRILVVADKYQTGFDQPLLTTMYVEKPLAGVAAVQTLSRLNRTHPLKNQEDLFVLDFANEAEDIQKEFKPYYEEAVTTPADPNLLYEKQRVLMEHQLLVPSEIQSFYDAYAEAQPAANEQSRLRGWEKKHAALVRLTDPARDRFAKIHHEDRDAAELFRSDLADYVRKYGFLSQVMQYTDDELEMLYLFAKHLLPQLTSRADPAMDIGEVDLTHLRVSKTGEHDVSLEPEGEQMLPGFDDGAAALPKDPRKALLSELIEEFNDRYGLGLSDADRLMYEERIVAAAGDPDLEQAAVASRNEGDFEMPFNQRFNDIMVERAEADTKFTEKYFSDKEFQGRLTREARKAAYRMIRRRHGLSDTTA